MFPPMRTPALLLLIAAFSGLAHGQGLRVPVDSKEGESRFELGSGGVPGVSQGEDGNALGSSWLAASWKPFGEGLRTSLGMVWRDRQEHLYRAPGESDLFGRLSTPYVGVGWSGAVTENSRWRLSAEMGTMLLGSGNCSADVSCLSVPSVGLKPDSQGGGMRFNPYVTFGATFSY
ncbi:hypothetical protein [Uliginosibacterium sp. H1]|uniref:hypothetical protein n=1 Tax=Uliginosibacterium sp. H1 TaxID=3114757 RepID=UPI002E188299|nr:hypothetical protein [Uliginosibacterium sp. H1]